LTAAWFGPLTSGWQQLAVPGVDLAAAARAASEVPARNTYRSTPMTAITARPLSDSTDSLLRFAMRADATLCGAAGLLVALAADPLSRLSGLSATAEWLTGAAFVVYGAMLYVLAAVPDLRRVGIGPAAANLVFSAAVLIVLVTGVLPLTAFGVGLTLAFTAATVFLGYLQYLGVRRLPA
jgi:hypothetical protein